MLATQRKVEFLNTHTQTSGFQGVCVCRARSHGRALTLVSFTKGVSPPRRPTLHTWSLKAWGSQKNGQKHDRAECCSSASHFLWTHREQNKRKTRLSGRIKSVWSHAHLFLPTSQHTPSREKCLCASPSNPGLSRSPVTCPVALPDTHGHQLVIRPLIRQWRPEGKEKATVTLVIKLFWGTKLFKAKNWSRFDPRSVPKSSFKPTTVRVWQGGSTEGQMWGEGCVQSSTQTAGGVFQRDKVCVCVCVCVDWSTNQCGPLTFNGTFWIPWREPAIYSMICYLPDQSLCVLPPLGQRPNDLWPGLTVSAPATQTHCPHVPISVPWSPLEPRILKHSSIWFIIKEYEVYDELSLFYILQWMKKTV